MRQFAGYFLVVPCIATFVFNPFIGAWIGSLIVIVFLLAEIAKKNNFYSTFYRAMPERSLTHHWQGASAEGKNPAMRNIRFRSKSGERFVLLVGFQVSAPILGIDWFHTYGAIESDHNGVVTVKTWMGKRPCEFRYMATIPGSDIVVTHGDEVQHLEPRYTHWPHWYQMWPLYLWG
jgi:hypothetical protein